LAEKLNRAVFDTNVVIRAILFRTSSPRLALTRAFEIGLILSSSATRNELREVILRPKFDRYIPLDLRKDAIEDLIEDMEAVGDIDHFQVCIDPKDDKFLQLAVSGRADVIVTGDPHLLQLHPFRGISIVAPAVYLTGFRG
jgi:putative PIN family toxin of toxin-antitoxin system